MSIENTNSEEISEEDFAELKAKFATATRRDGVGVAIVRWGEGKESFSTDVRFFGTLQMQAAVALGLLEGMAERMPEFRLAHAMLEAALGRALGETVQ